MIKSTISHYRVLTHIASGGMGDVYLADDMNLDRKVALKILPAAFTTDAERVRRFTQEAKAASALNHPNIVTIHEIGVADGTHYIAMEFIEGETLRQKMAGGRRKLGTVLDLAARVASALNAAHGAGIVHRDIKMENLMVRPDRLVKVLDFGLAKLTERRPSPTASDAPTGLMAGTDPGTVMGTVKCMSPEQARGLQIDARSDLFSLGIVLYEMTTARPLSGVRPSPISFSRL